jgi:uncharacterized protein YjbI with pentapeptide repeats
LAITYFKITMPRPGSLSKDPKVSRLDRSERAEKSLDAANEAARVVRNVYITFLLLGTYIGVIIASTTDEQLLRGSTVILPLLDVKLSIKGFYAVVPWGLVFFHFNLLLQLSLLARKLHVFDNDVDYLSASQAAAFKERLFSFPFVHMLIARQHDRITRMVQAVVVWITVIVLPLWLLLWAQIAFLPYHDPEVTRWQKLAVVADAVIVSLFWARIVLFWKHKQRKANSDREILVATAVITGVTALAMTFTSFQLANVPHDRSEAEGVFFDRRLDLEGKLLTRNELEGEVVNILREGSSDARGRVLQKALGLDLEERDLRFARLPKAILPNVNLRGADLQAAYLSRAQLQNADLSEARLRGADLDQAQLQGANLAMAQLQAAELRGAALQAADLRDARLQEASLNNAQLQGASLVGAQMEGADLSDASLQAAELRGAQLKGANLERANLQAVDLRGAQLQGAKLVGVQLQGADLSDAQLQAVDLRDAQLQGASFNRAQLQGVDLRRASVGSARFDGARLDSADLRDIDDSPLTLAEYESIREVATRWIDEEVLRDRLIDDLQALVGKEISLSAVGSTKGCLANEVQRLPGCMTEAQEKKYQTALGTELLMLACSDRDIALGIVRRAFENPRLARILYAGQCAVLRSLPEGIKEKLEQATKRSLTPRL